MTEDKPGIQFFAVDPETGHREPLEPPEPVMDWDGAVATVRSLVRRNELPHVVAVVHGQEFEDRQPRSRPTGEILNLDVGGGYFRVLVQSLPHAALLGPTMSDFEWEELSNPETAATAPEAAALVHAYSVELEELWGMKPRLVQHADPQGLLPARYAGQTIVVPPQHPAAAPHGPSPVP